MSPSNSLSTSTSLLGRLREDDAKAWNRCVRIYGPLIYDWCRYCGLDPEDAADVSQEVFRVVVVKISGFHRDRPDDSFKGWLWTITRNKIRDLLRRRKDKAVARGGTDAQHWLLQIPDECPDTSTSGTRSSLFGTAERRAIEIVRKTVQPRTWRAFWMVSIEDRAPIDVAKDLDTTVRAVYNATWRVRRLLHRELEGLFDGT